MIGHLGARVSDLLDGRLDQVEEDRAWEHVHACHQCRDRVEREGWVKTQLAALAWSSTDLSSELKGHLRVSLPGLTPGESYLAAPDRGRNRAGLAAIGSGALGFAVLGILAIPASPAAAPAMEWRPSSRTTSGSQTGPLTLVSAFADLQRSLKSAGESHPVREQDKMSR